MPLLPRGRQPPKARAARTRAGQHLVHYEDGVEEWLDFAKERVDWESAPDLAPAAPGDDVPAEAGAPDAAAPRPAGRASQEPAQPARRALEAGTPAADSDVADGAGAAEDEAPGAAGGAPAQREPRRSDGPAAVAVCCNGLRGALDALRLVITLEGGKRVSPTEFERLAGKAASKKWKASLRVDKARARRRSSALNLVLPYRSPPERLHSFFRLLCRPPRALPVAASAWLRPRLAPVERALPARPPCHHGSGSERWPPCCNVARLPSTSNAALRRRVQGMRLAL